MRGRGAKIVAVEPHRFAGIEIGEMVGEGKGRADLAGKLRRIIGRAEQIDRRQRHVRRHGAHIVERMAGGEPARLQQHQFVEALEEVVLFADALAAP